MRYWLVLSLFLCPVLQAEPTEVNPYQSPSHAADNRNLAQLWSRYRLVENAGAAAQTANLVLTLGIGVAAGVWVGTQVLPEYGAPIIALSPVVSGISAMGFSATLNRWVEGSKRAIAQLVENSVLLTPLAELSEISAPVLKGLRSLPVEPRCHIILQIAEDRAAAIR